MEEHEVGNTKVLIVNDIHLRDRPPSSATDSYVDDLFDLLDHVARISKELKVDMVVWAGDVFDHKQPVKTSHKLVQRAIEAAQKFDNLWVIIGNHDITQDRLDTLDQQPFGVLVKSGAVKVLTGWHPDFPVFGVHWQQDWHDPDTRMAAFELWRSAGGVDEGPEVAAVDLREALVVTHAPLYPLGEENEFDHIPTAGEDGISAAMGNMGYLTYGHIHEDHGIFESNGVTYANHGALSRGSLHEYNRYREIAATLWEEGVGFSKVPIPHKPAEEVFRITEVDAEKAEKLSLDEFLTGVGRNTFEVASIESIMEYIRKMEIDPEVKARALAVVEETT